MGADLFLVDPVVLALLPGLDFAVLEPKSNLLLGVLDGVAAVADVAANILCHISMRTRPRLWTAEILAVTNWLRTMA